MSKRILCSILLLAAACAHDHPLLVEQDSPLEADAYFAAKRAGASPARYDAAREQMARMSTHVTGDDRRQSRVAAESDTAVGAWSFLGPGNVGGRTRSLLIDPNDTNTMYAGAISGGVWKTVDSGASWTAMGDQLANLDVSTLAFDPRSTQVIYAGTGEGYFREDVRGTALPIRGDGIYVTLDGGRSWARLPSTANDDFQWVNDIIVSTHDPNRVYAATRSGVFRSVDAGASWTRVLPTTVKGGCLDLAFRGDTDGDYLFAACGVFEQATLYRNPRAESDAAWTSVLSEAGMSRTSIAIAPSNPNVVYALAAANPNQNLLAVFRSDSAGDPGSWTALVRGTNNSDPTSPFLLTNLIAAVQNRCTSNASTSFVPMGWHCNVIAVDPLDSERVWAAGVDLFRSDDGGRTWGVASYWWPDDVQPAFVHADQHVIQFDPHYDGGANQRLFATNDGGVFRTDNARAPVALGNKAPCDPAFSQVRFTSLNHHYGATQFYHGLPFPDGKRFFGGAQDNGTNIGSIDGGIDGWQMINGGDGAYVAIDPLFPQVIYMESQNAAIVKSIDGGVHVRNGSNGLHDNFLFVTPFIVDPNEHTRLWAGGGTRIWRSNDLAQNWNAVSALLPNGAQASAIAAAPGLHGRIVAGTTLGDIVMNDDALASTFTTSWKSVHPRDGWVSSITFDPTNVDTIYATYALFGGTHVWKSIDAGATWTPLGGEGEGALPDIPVHALAVDPTQPTRLYLGTDLGIFATTDGGAHWQVENTGFSAVITEQVVVGQGSHGPAVYAFTHGRGAWRAELTAAPRHRVTR